MHMKTRRPLFIIVGLLAVAGAASEEDTGYFQPPELDGFEVIEPVRVDVNDDGTPESLLSKYTHAVGDSILSISTQDRVWVWSVSRSLGDPDDIERNHNILDTNCDGEFDTRLPRKQDVHIPACLTGAHVPPGLEGYKFTQEFKADGDNNGTEETTGYAYQDDDGNVRYVLVAGNQVWAWTQQSKDFPADKDDLEKNYTLRDANCDGGFDQRLSPTDKVVLPDCLK